MTRPKDIVPTQYEVLKLLNGTEVVGMTRDTGNGIEITLPMTVSYTHLTLPTILLV